MRKALIIGLLALAAPSTARADVGIGLFLGDPSGLDLKIDLSGRSALDVVLGWHTFREGRSGYGHVTYLFTLFAGHGRSIVVPFRLGIGGALYGNSDHVNAGVRAPLEVGLRFRRTPIEVYGEIAALVTFIDDNWGDRFDIQGGVGIRFYF